MEKRSILAVTLSFLQILLILSLLVASIFVPFFKLDFSKASFETAYGDGLCIETDDKYVFALNRASTFNYAANKTVKFSVFDAIIGTIDFFKDIKKIGILMKIEEYDNGISGEKEDAEFLAEKIFEKQNYITKHADKVKEIQEELINSEGGVSKYTLLRHVIVPSLVQGGGGLVAIFVAVVFCAAIVFNAFFEALGSMKEFIKNRNKPPQKLFYSTEPTDTMSDIPGLLTSLTVMSVILGNIFSLEIAAVTAMVTLLAISAFSGIIRLIYEQNHGQALMNDKKLVTQYFLSLATVAILFVAIIFGGTGLDLKLNYSDLSNIGSKYYLIYAIKVVLSITLVIVFNKACKDLSGFGVSWRTIVKKANSGESPTVTFRRKNTVSVSILLISSIAALLFGAPETIVLIAALLLLAIGIIDNKSNTKNNEVMENNTTQESESPANQ